MEGSKPKKLKPQSKPITISELFADKPAGTKAIVSDALRLRSNEYTIRYRPIKLYCDHEDCESITTFEPDSKASRLFPEHSTDKEIAKTISFTCRNCQVLTKLFAIHVRMKIAGGTEMVEIIKVGEYPPFDQSTPKELLEKLGSSRELFHRGKLSEAHNLGIGAFAYYRRVVEYQKDWLLDDIITICSIVGSDKETKKGLEAALKEKGFLKAIDSIKPNVPESLLIDGHNPLTLLHDAIRRGLQEGSDEECLKMAKHIRVVLSALAQKMDIAVSEDQEVKRAVSDLLAKKSAKKSAKK